MLIAGGGSTVKRCRWEKCQKPLVLKPGYERKKYCGKNCAMAWHHKHVEGPKRRAKRAPPVVISKRCEGCPTSFDVFSRDRVGKRKRFCSQRCKNVHFTRKRRDKELERSAHPDKMVLEAVFWASIHLGSALGMAISDVFRWTWARQAGRMRRLIRKGFIVRVSRSPARYALTRKGLIHLRVLDRRKREYSWPPHEKEEGEAKNGRARRTQGRNTGPVQLGRRARGGREVQALVASG